MVNVGKVSVLLAAALLMAVLALGLGLPERMVQSATPEFAAMTDAKVRKAAFFEFLGELVATENHVIAMERQRLEALAGRENLSWLDRRQLARLSRKYLSPEQDEGTEARAQLGALLERVDTIPAALALAQGAKESGWGTARFAVEGNNYFGQRCWEPGCGMLPRARASGQRHEVAVFATPGASVASYLLNLNTHEDYAALRERRAELRARGEPVSGITLAEELLRYSERGEAYIEEIKALIAFNKLEQEL